MNTYTPGPWKHACDSYGKVQHSRKACVYTTKHEPDGDLLYTIAGRIENWADAKLIAAAPEIYEAAEAFTSAAHRKSPTSPEFWAACEALERALAKARGERVSA